MPGPAPTQLLSRARRKSASQADSESLQNRRSQRSVGYTRDKRLEERSMVAGGSGLLASAYPLEAQQEGGGRVEKEIEYVQGAGQRPGEQHPQFLP